MIGTGNCGEDGLPNVKWTLCADGTLYLTGVGPTQSCNRAQVVTFLYRAFAE